MFVKWDQQYYSRGRSNFEQKTHTVGLPGSIWADWLNDKQETKRTKETQFSLEKKYSIKVKMNSVWTPRNITSLDRSSYEAIDSLVSQNIFSYLEMFSMQCRKKITELNTAAWSCCWQ